MKALRCPHCGARVESKAKAEPAMRTGVQEYVLERMFKIQRINGGFV